MTDSKTPGTVKEVLDILEIAQAENRRLKRELAAAKAATREANDPYAHKKRMAILQCAEKAEARINELEAALADANAVLLAVANSEFANQFWTLKDLAARAMLAAAGKVEG